MNRIRLAWSAFLVKSLRPDLWADVRSATLADQADDQSAEYADAMRRAAQVWADELADVQQLDMEQRAARAEGLG